MTDPLEREIRHIADSLCDVETYSELYSHLVEMDAVSGRALLWALLTNEEHREAYLRKIREEIAEAKLKYAPRDDWL